MREYIDKFVESRTEAARAVGDLPKLSPVTIGQTVSSVRDAIVEPVFMTLATAWIGIGTVRPASTNDTGKDDKDNETVKRFATQFRDEMDVTNSGSYINRWYYNKLWYMQIGQYAMPMSQSFTLRAKKRLNTSSLVDGVDIIQQTRKEAKTIDCILRIGLTQDQSNLQILKQDVTGTAQSYDGQRAEIAKLSQFLQDFYDRDQVLRIFNDEINNTFGVTYVIITEYRFIPRTGMGTFSFEFSLTEVKYGENVLTFNLREVNSDSEPRRQITDQP